MDFGSILYAAQKNSQSGKKEPEKKFYSTKFEPPKKEVKEKKLSENIQKFLAKKEIEEREQKMMADQKRQELLSKRDNKAKNKINKMLKVIKSANKSVLDDAVDNADTAVTLEGPDQPDEDDYGYVSQEASHFYKNLMDKYKAQPDQKIKGSKGQKALSKDEMRNMKARVTAAINREKEEENQPHRRQRQPKSSTEITKTGDSSTKYEKYPGPSDEKPKPKPKPKRPPPPIMDFNQLLKLAEQKQFEPIEVTVPVLKKGPERLMTTKEKLEYEEHRAFTEAKDKRQKLGEKAPGKPIAKPDSQIKNGTNGRIPKLSQSGSSGQSSKLNSTKSVPDRPKFSSTSREMLESKNKLKTILSSGDKGRDVPQQKKTPSASTSKLPANQQTNSSKGRQFPPADVKTRSLPPVNGKTKQIPPADVKTRQFPPPDVRGREFPPQDLKRGKPLSSKNIQSKKRRIIDDDDSEYDSEMDDFIDDEEGPDDYSKHISEIFGYDKSKYRDIDDDDRGMESTFAQQMREEFVSKKIGMAEDLEDMKQEELEKKQKLMKKNRK